MLLASLSAKLSVFIIGVVKRVWGYLFFFQFLATTAIALSHGRLLIILQLNFLLHLKCARKSIKVTN